LVNPERQASFRDLLHGYYYSLAEHLVKEHKALQKIERKNRRAMHTHGEVRQEDEETAERLQKSYEKLFSNTSTLAVRSTANPIKSSNAPTITACTFRIY
jgi:regulator of nonsense transcripts 2